MLKRIKRFTIWSHCIDPKASQETSLKYHLSPYLNFTELRGWSVDKVNTVDIKGSILFLHCFRRSGRVNVTQLQGRLAKSQHS